MELRNRLHVIAVLKAPLEDSDFAQTYHLDVGGYEIRKPDQFQKLINAVGYLFFYIIQVIYL